MSSVTYLFRIATKVLAMVTSTPKDAVIGFDPNGDIRTKYRGIDTHLDAKRRFIYQRGRVVAQFSAVSSVSVVPGGEDDRNYRVQLHLNRRQTLSVGCTDDDSDASVLAARIATLIGVSVEAHPGPPRPVLF